LDPVSRDADDIEPGRGKARLPDSQVHLGHSSQLPPLSLLDGFSSKPGVRIRAAADFNKDELVAIPGDQVDFSDTASEVGFEYSQARRL